MPSISSFFTKNALYIALVQAIVATLGSLYFSEIAHYTPCELCWFQRIAMYPLVLVLIVGILRRDKWVYQYVFPAAIVGWFIALYHNLLYLHILPWWNQPCSSGVSCTTKYISWGGFITIPFLAFVAFSVILAMMVIARKAALNDSINAGPGNLSA